MSTSTNNFDPQRLLRRQHEQCHNCHISKADSSRSIGNVTLRECASCHVAKYCSRACQRSHWKVHKPRCAQHKEQAEKLSTRHQEPSGYSNDATLRPQDMLNEVGSWKKRAMPFLFQAGYNAFDLAGNYLAWIDNFLVISLERLPEVDASSPHWSRFRVLKVEKMHVRDFCEEAIMSPKDVKDLVDQKTLMEDENIRKGAHGTISIALRISCPRFPDVALVNFLYAAYMKGDERAINITSNWKEEFMDSLGKMCEGDA